jgi:hypothetical protein
LERRRDGVRSATIAASFRSSVLCAPSRRGIPPRRRGVAQGGIMKVTNLARLLFVVTLATALVTPLAVAQEAPSMVTVLTVRTEIGSGPAYEAQLKEIWKAFKAGGMGAQVFVSTGMEQPGSYTFVVPVASWAEFGEVNAKIQAAYASIPSVMQKVSATIDSWTQEMWLARPDLSYRPAKPRLGDSEMGFTRIALLYARPEHEPALVEALKGSIALRAKHGLPTGTEVYQLAMGSDGPAYAVVLGGKDVSDYYTQDAKNIATMGADWQAYLQQVGPYLRRVEYLSSNARPDQLFTP